MLPVQVIDAATGMVLEELCLDIQPGAAVELATQTYTVLEKRHYYQLRDGRYRLCAMRAFVQVTESERCQLDGQWVIGDPSCRYNARSPLLRCAINPTGPCASCGDYEKGDPEATLT